MSRKKREKKGLIGKGGNFKSERNVLSSGFTCFKASGLAPNLIE